MIGATPSAGQSTADYLEEVVRSIAWAINERRWNIPSATKGIAKTESHPVWYRFANDFQAEPEYLSAAVARKDPEPLPVMLADRGSKATVGGRDAIQDMFRRIAQEFPDYRMIIGDVDTTVHEQARWAISYVSMENHDMPPGVVRQSLGVFEWKKTNGEWFLSKYEGMAGIAPR